MLVQSSPLLYDLLTDSEYNDAKQLSTAEIITHFRNLIHSSSASFVNVSLHSIILVD